MQGPTLDAFIILIELIIPTIKIWFSYKRYIIPFFNSFTIKIAFIVKLFPSIKFNPPISVTPYPSIESIVFTH